MAPPAKSSTDTQEKDLMLDKDMEKDTWNFKSMTDDDPMDFGFESPAKNKKNAFKLDMGFDLAGDFGNLSSFKMDMPDFDFSSPAKKTSKKKESSDDKPGGNSKQKKNPFAFSYDFDALDDFDLDSSPPKKGSEPVTSPMDCKEISGKRNTDKSDAFDFGPDLPVTRQAASMENTGVKAKASAENEKQDLKTADTMAVDSSKHLNQAALESMENSKAVEPPQGPRIETSRTHTMCSQPQSAKTSSPLKETSPLERSCPSVEEIGEPCPSNETAAPSPVHASEIAHRAVSRQTSPDNHEICRSSPEDDCPRDPEHNVDKRMIFTMESSYEKTEQTASSISSQSCSDKIEHQQEELDTGTQAEIQDHTRKLRDSDAGQSQTNLSGKISRPTQTSQVQDSSGKLPLDPSHSLPGLNDLKAIQHKDSGFIRSRFFKMPEKPQSSPTRTEIQPFTREKIGLSLNPTNDRRHGNKDALPGSTNRACATQLVNMDSDKKTTKVNTSSSHEKIIHKDHSNAKTVENVSGLMDHLKLQAKNTTREKSILQINISSKLDASSLTQKLSRNLSSGAESLQKSKMASLERPKFGNIVSDLRAAKPQRTIKVKVAQPEVSTSVSKENNAEAPVKKSSEIPHLASTPGDKTKINQCPSSLKRKALDEDADRSLKPQLKRFSMSPRENKNVEESRMDHDTTKELVKESPRTKSHHQIMNMANLEIPITENTDNIEKAEAFTKELDNICNILKKKHEEAKELLVRAVVNNNKLLMLNHPLHEDKIRMIQKFAAKLSLRDT